MFMGRPNHLESPDFEAFLYVLERVILEIRKSARSGNMVSEDQLNDLMDAIHNIPTMLAENHGWNVPEKVLADLEHYDRKWHGKSGTAIDLGLVILYQDGKKMAVKQASDYYSNRIERLRAATPKPPG